MPGSHRCVQIGFALMLLLGSSEARAFTYAVSFDVLQLNGVSFSLPDAGWGLFTFADPQPTPGTAPAIYFEIGQSGSPAFLTMADFVSFNLSTFDASGLVGIGLQVTDTGTGTLTMSEYLGWSGVTLFGADTVAGTYTFTLVPEPGSMVLVATGLVALAAHRRGRRLP